MQFPCARGDLLHHAVVNGNLADARHQIMLGVPVGTPVCEFFAVNRPSNTALTDCENTPQTALHCAIMLKKKEMIKLLLEHNASVEVTTTGDEGGSTALHLTMSLCAPSPFIMPLVRLVLTHGAVGVVNARDNHGQTALMQAAMRGGRGSNEIVKLLLDHHADPDIVTPDGDSAFSLIDLVIQDNRDILDTC